MHGLLRIRRRCRGGHRGWRAVGHRVFEQGRPRRWWPGGRLRPRSLKLWRRLCFKRRGGASGWDSRCCVRWGGGGACGCTVAAAAARACGGNEQTRVWTSRDGGLRKHQRHARPTRSTGGTPLQERPVQLVTGASPTNPAFRSVGSTTHGVEPLGLRAHGRRLRSCMGAFWPHAGSRAAPDGGPRL